MNRKQFAYQLGRGTNNYPDALFAGFTSGFGYASIEQFTEGHFFTGTVFGLFTAYWGSRAFWYGAARYFLLREAKPLQEQKDNYPFEHAESIIIDDKPGLEGLLQQTRADMEKEWGTVLKAHPEPSEIVVIDDILTPQMARECGFVGEGKRTSVKFWTRKAIEAGYNGCQHYHPSTGSAWFNAADFSISPIDRYFPAGWMNLLTFNMPEGPEIVGFNRKYTYIPVDKSKCCVA